MTFKASLVNLVNTASARFTRTTNDVARSATPAHLLGSGPAPAKPAGARAHMDHVYAIRRAVYA